MFIHQHICISPQQTTEEVNLTKITPSVKGKLFAIEPKLDGVPPGMLRRMSKAVRMGLGAGMPILTHQNVNGIIIGTANGGMEDCIKFLNQIIDYEEGMLTPGNFVQSTPNAIAGQLSLVTKNHGYNATHVHFGLAFETALLDAQMLLAENPEDNYLVGGIDEISAYNYNIDLLAGWFSKDVSNENLYSSGASTTIAGEGAAFFLVNNQPQQAIAGIKAIKTLHSTEPEQVQLALHTFLTQNDIRAENMIALFGENGDVRLNSFYEACEHLIKDMPLAHFKHLCGEYPTASSFALWLACHMLQEQDLPAHFYKRSPSRRFGQVMIYNNYQGKQHSFMLIEKCV
ncbi:MAG: beta-ketoacyl synthase chain length factor [Niabella sp.]